ncbi:hypothetical protein P7K49_007397 [Saguinus oedipus]|uniref:Uncharacterized protein n=1 Tax=Saguinus oedipus TaxID=9490 RepID=A0ABQ9VUR4_SAGOE|nr:hypothetical protein P7K49_007397 [Saguinus oedipus]
MGPSMSCPREAPGPSLAGSICSLQVLAVSPSHAGDMGPHTKDVSKSKIDELGHAPCSSSYPESCENIRSVDKEETKRTRMTSVAVQVQQGGAQAPSSYRGCTSNISKARKKPTGLVNNTEEIRDQLPTTSLHIENISYQKFKAYRKNGDGVCTRRGEIICVLLSLHLGVPFVTVTVVTILSRYVFHVIHWGVSF